MLDKGDEIVYVKDYRNVQKPCWTKGTIVQKLGKQTYLCKPLDNSSLTWKRHLDQMIKVGKFYDEPSQRSSEEAKPIRLTADPSDSFMDTGNITSVIAKPTITVTDTISEEVSNVHSEIVPDPNTEIIEDKLESNKDTNDLITTIVSSPNVKSRPRREIRPPNRLNL
ncbi:hypothetical protein QE152_g37526 [Popillia japonica]|uniref:Uncharacterized protein n=1 Tax=Popillia japonica TaxID=7064 RepID=A0AAW1IA94_POPJA